MGTRFFFRVRVWLNTNKNNFLTAKGVLRAQWELSVGSAQHSGRRPESGRQPLSVNLLKWPKDTQDNVASLAFGLTDINN